MHYQIYWKDAGMCKDSTAHSINKREPLYHEIPRKSFTSEITTRSKETNWTKTPVYKNNEVQAQC
jgi:hypothetical protein